MDPNPAAIRKWHAVIPSDRIDAAANCIKSIMGAHQDVEAARIIVVSKEITPAEIGKVAPGVVLIKDPSEFCFARRVNLGIERVNPWDVVVIGDDVEVVTHGAFDLMAEEAPLRILAASVVGRVGPWWQAQPSADNAHSMPPANRFPEVPFVSFVCVYLPRLLLRIIGSLDENFPGYGYEDTDYCLRARKAGLSCGVSGVVVEHTVKIKSNFVEKHSAQLPTMESDALSAFSKKWTLRT